jgi:hypothetical protein
MNNDYGMFVGTILVLAGLVLWARYSLAKKEFLKSVSNKEKSTVVTRPVTEKNKSLVPYFCITIITIGIIIFTASVASPRFFLT